MLGKVVGMHKVVSTFSAFTSSGENLSTGSTGNTETGGVGENRTLVGIAGLLIVAGCIPGNVES